MTPQSLGAHINDRPALHEKTVCEAYAHIRTPGSGWVNLRPLGPLGAAFHHGNPCHTRSHGLVSMYAAGVFGSDPVPNSVTKVCRIEVGRWIWIALAQHFLLHNLYLVFAVRHRRDGLLEISP